MVATDYTFRFTVNNLRNGNIFPDTIERTAGRPVSRLSLRANTLKPSSASPDSTIIVTMENHKRPPDCGSRHPSHLQCTESPKRTCPGGATQQHTIRSLHSKTSRPPSRTGRGTISRKCLPGQNPGLWRLQPTNHSAKTKAHKPTSTPALVRPSWEAALQHLR